MRSNGDVGILSLASEPSAAKKSTRCSEHTLVWTKFRVLKRSCGYIGDHFLALGASLKAEPRTCTERYVSHFGTFSSGWLIKIDWSFIHSTELYANKLHSGNVTENLTQECWFNKRFLISTYQLPHGFYSHKLSNTDNWARLWINNIFLNSKRVMLSLFGS